MDVRDALPAVAMSVAALVVAVAAVRTSIQVRRSVSIEQPWLLVASRSSTATACGMLAASFLLSASRRLSLVLLIAALIAFVFGVLVERIRARRIETNRPSAADERT
jgi:ABC-type xylose transport system permease subunit